MKNNKLIIILIVFFLLISLSSTGYVVYNKYLKKGPENEEKKEILNEDITASELGIKLYNNIKIEEGAFYKSDTKVLASTDNKMKLFFGANKAQKGTENVTTEKCISSKTYKAGAVQEIKCEDEKDGQTVYKPYKYTGEFITKENMDAAIKEIFGDVTVEVTVFDYKNMHFIFDETSKKYLGYKETDETNNIYNATYAKVSKTANNTVEMDYYTLEITKEEFDAQEKQQTIAQNLTTATHYKLVFTMGEDNNYYLESIEIQK